MEGEQEKGLKAEGAQEGGVHAEGEQAVGVATNRPRKVSICEAAEEKMPGASSLSKQKRSVRQALELVNQQVLDTMMDLAHASSLISRRIRH